MAATFNYTYPATGVTAPTAAQVQSQNEVIANVITDGVITTFTVTHNLGISAADLTSGFPDVIIEPLTVHAGDGTLTLSISSKTANTVVFLCAAVVATLNVKVTRPSSLAR